MSKNTELQKIFDELAAGIDLLGGESFRASSHRRVARALRDLPEDVGELVARDRPSAARRLVEIPGIGKGAARRILEYLERGELAEHQELRRQVPAGVFELLEIPGIGPQAAKTLWRELGVESVADLRSMLERDEVAGLPRMGAKTAENLRAAIDFRAKTADRLPIGRALPLALALVERLRALPGVSRAAYAGSLRRGKETIGDLDLLVASSDAERACEAFAAMPEVERILARGESKVSVRLRAAGGSRALVQADLRLVPAASWGAALLYFTGSKEHNVELRERAIARGMRLNEYGLYRHDRGDAPRPHERGERPVAAAEEAQIYSALGLPFVPPELREEGVDPAAIPDDLITLDDLRAELHAHTTASDGRLGILELAQVAKARGYHTLAITDHSPSSVIAGGLSPDRLRRHAQAIREADTQIRGIRLLAGTEVDILPDGRLDYSDELLAGLDLVVASPHVSLRQGRKQATERLLAAIRHPLVHVIGHPTGRFVGERAGLDPDLPRLVEAAAECKTALEINANPRRLDLRDRHVRLALEAGCLIAIDTDAHSERGFGFLPYGVLTARRAGLPRARCLNAWPRARLLRWLAAKR